MRGAGFYKLDGDMLLYGANFAVNANYELYKEQKDTYTYPVDGWSWYESEQAACSGNGIPYVPPVDPQSDTPVLPPPPPLGA